MRTIVWLSLGVLAAGAAGLAWLAHWIGGLDDPADLLAADGWERGPDPDPRSTVTRP